MSSVFIKQGNTFRITDHANLDMHEKLPVGTYTIKMDERENFYFEQISDFKISGKIYGEATKQATRIINTFADRPHTTGVLLAGEKGSGKTLLMKTLSIELAKQDIPTIIINTPWRGDKFNTLIQSIEQPCLVCWDEFEKVYDRDEQTEVLTLLDGVFPSKKLFILTVNDKYRVDDHMRNRPGRIFYLLDFKGLDVDFITEYCQDNLNDKTQTENVCRCSTMFMEFNFDMLKALVEEMNRYNETAQEAIKMLNAKPQANDGGRFDVKLVVDGFEIPDTNMDTETWNGNPLASEEIHLRVYGTEDDDDRPRAVKDYTTPSLGQALATMVSGSLPKEDTVYKFTYLHLKKIDPVEGKFVYANDSGAVATFTKVRSKYLEYAF